MASIQNEEIFQFLSGTSDNGKSIAFNVETKKNNVALNFEHIVNPAELLIDLETGSNVTVMAALDNGPFNVVGVINAGMTRLAFDIDPTTGDFPRCRELSIAFRENSTSKVRINQVALNYYDTSEVESVPISE